MNRAQPWIRRPIAILAFIAACVAIGCDAWAADDPWAGLLASERWQERGHGLSLRPPLGSRLVAQTADDALVRILGDSGYTVTVSYKSGKDELTLDQIVQMAVAQLGVAQPAARVLEQKPIQAGGLAGQVVYYLIPPQKKQSPWVMGQAFAQVNPHEFVVLQLEVDHDRFPAAREMFEAVVASVELRDPESLNRERAECVGRGEAWRRSIDTERLRRALQGEQWFRIVENDTDIGYMRVTETSATEMDLPGVRVEIQTRLMLGGTNYDSLSSFFASDDGGYEAWSIRTTARPAGGGAGAASASPSGGGESWAQTGVRSKDQITVTVQGPGGTDEYHWQRPPKGYLSQVDLYLLERLQASTGGQGLGFYAYYPNRQEITYRQSRTVTGPDGTFVVHTLPSPEQEEQVSYYGADGRLIKRVLPQGRVILPTTPNQLAGQWGLR